MGYEDRLTGTDLVVKFTPDGGSIITITGDNTSFNTDRKLDTVDVSAGNEQERSFKGTLESLDWTIMIFDADQAYLPDILPRATGLLEIFKVGVGSGKPVIAFNTLITGATEDYPFDGALEIEISGVRNGPMVNEVGDVQS